MTGWTVVLPVKDLAKAKRRLAPDVGPWRSSLAGAFASDVLDATLALPRVDRVVVVGGDGIGPRALAVSRVTQLPDVGDLDAAVARGTNNARTEQTARILVLQADLPCVRPSDLEDLLTHAPPSRPGVLADAEGLGTVALTIPLGTTLATAFGAGSFERHVRAGADPIALAAPRLRRDVDTYAHLREAVILGVGRHTQRVLDQMSFPAPSDLTA